MNKTLYEYSVLRYRHSQLLGEVLNVGLLFFFHEDKEVEFLYPKSIGRISGLYKNFSTKTLRHFLSAFDQQAKKLSKQSAKLFDPDRLEDIIEEYFLIEDATVLGFDQPKSGNYRNKKDILSYYKEQFLSDYEIKKKEKRKNEAYIIDKVEEGFGKYQLRNKKSIQKNYRLDSEYATEQFHYAWQNGTTNLITPVSFDYKREVDILDKAYIWRGKLDAFEETASRNDLRFDLILSKPSKQEFLAKYHNGRHLLEESPSPIQITEIDELEQYLKRIQSSLK